MEMASTLQLAIVSMRRQLFGRETIHLRLLSPDVNETTLLSCSPLGREGDPFSPGSYCELGPRKQGFRRWQNLVVEHDGG